MSDQSLIDARKALLGVADIVLTLNADGTVLEAAFTSRDMRLDFEDATGVATVGMNWLSSVTEESSEKANALLAPTGHEQGEPRRREINHGPPTNSLPLQYSRVAGLDQIVLCAQDIRPIARLQTRLMNAQVSLEREFLTLRASDTKYRLLSHMIEEPLIVVDAITERIIEMNGAACAFFSVDRDPQKLSGRTLKDVLQADDARQLITFVDRAKANGQSASGELQNDAGPASPVYVSLFRQLRQGCAMILVDAAAHPLARAEDDELRAMQLVVDHSPDAFAVIDSNRRVITANTAFVELVQVGTKQSLIGCVVDNWFERPNVDYSILMATLREHRVVRRFATLIKGELGSSENVEISAVLVDDNNGKPLYGLSIRRVSVAVMNDQTDRSELPRTTDQITSLVGHMPLKDIVKETTGLIEQICIETALKLTGDNRASAAQMLGLSRQSLYAKLGKFDDNNNEDAS